MIVAAHNEEQRLGDTLTELRAVFPNALLAVADDASADRTPEIAETHGADLVRTERRLGKGGANTLAAEHVLQKSEPQIVLLCDGDLGESAAELAKLVTGEADVVVATFARRVGGGFGLAIGLSRRAVRKDRKSVV